MKKESVILVLIVTFILLLIPLVAMQFTNEIKWDLKDFLVMGAMLFVTGLLIEVVFRRFKNSVFKWLFCGFVILAFLLVWAEMAVGIFGSSISGS
jgi:bacteriorhodopsin